MRTRNIVWTDNRLRTRLRRLWHWRLIRLLDDATGEMNKLLEERQR